MKIILVSVALGAVLIAPAVAQQAPQTRQGADSRVRVYAPDYYVQHHGNNNVNPDYQLGGDHR